MKVIGTMILPLLLALTVGGCGRSGSRTAPSPTLEILCAPAMRKPVEEIVRRFEAADGVKTQISYDASGALLGQLKLRPHGDVFIPADRFYTDQAVKLKLAEDAKIITWFVPVIAVKKGNPFGVKSLADLTNPKLRIGIGEERTTAIGKTTIDLLNRNNVPVGKVNIVYRAPKIDELGNALKLGTIDATIIWRAIALNYTESVDAVDIAPTRNIVVPVSAAVISASENKPLARKFMEFLCSSEAKQILMKHKYPTEPPAGNKEN